MQDAMISGFFGENMNKIHTRNVSTNIFLSAHQLVSASQSQVIVATCPMPTRSQPKGKRVYVIMNTTNFLTKVFGGFMLYCVSHVYLYVHM